MLEAAQVTSDTIRRGGLVRRPFYLEKILLSFEFAVYYGSQLRMRLADLGHLLPVMNVLLTLRLRKRLTEMSNFDCEPAFSGHSWPRI